MFQNCKNSNLKGNVGFGLCIAHFTQKGYIVSIPLNDSQDYDLIVDDGEKLKKVQVKTTSQIENNKYKVKLESCSHNFYSHFDKTKVDFLFVLCENGDAYNIPCTLIESKTSLSLGDKYKDYKI